MITAGVAGRSIAREMALAGYRTVLEDLVPGALRKAEHEIRLNLENAVGLKQFSQDDAREALARIEFADSLEGAARKADLVVEAVPDEMESKLEIFTLLDKICRPGTILASIALSLSITEIASVTLRTNKILGLRFSAPDEGRKQLEIVRTFETDDESIADVAEVGRRMGTEVVVVPDIFYRGAEGISRAPISQNPHIA